jgi:hypothetical protein
MKWFKHDSDAGNDAKLRKLRIKYGAQGYGIYWYCLELIARNVEKHNLTFELEHDAELIADDFKLSGEFVQEMMTYMVNLGLFENTRGVVTCLKMSNRTDEYTQQLIRDINRSAKNVPRVSLETSDTLTIISEVKEEKRREENINTKGTRLSNEWVMPDEWHQVAYEINNSLSKDKTKQIAAEFKDYWISLSGSKGIKNDWLATWRNWVRRQMQFTGSGNNQPNKNGVVI